MYLSILPFVTLLCLIRRDAEVSALANTQALIQVTIT